MNSSVKSEKLEVKSCARSRARGFTLLFAAIAGSVIFSVGIAIASIATREIALSSAGRESQSAFYAADAGAECALYWDRKENKFTGGASVSFSCAGKDITATPSDSVFPFTLPLAGAACARVKVNKTNGTVIESRGRNDCGGGDNPGRVERAIRVSY